MKVYFFPIKSIYKSSFFLLLFGLMFSGMGRVLTVNAQEALIEAPTMEEPNTAFAMQVNKSLSPARMATLSSLPIWSSDCTRSNLAACLPPYLTVSDLPSAWQPVVIAAAQTWSNVGTDFRFGNINVVTENMRKIAMEGIPTHIALGEVRVMLLSQLPGVQLKPDMNLPGAVTQAAIYHPDDAQGKYLGALIVINNVDLDIDRNWSLDGNPTSNQYDLKSVAMHELGHAAGLSHCFPCSVPFGGDVMGQGLGTGVVRSQLTALDKQSLINIYGPISPLGPPPSPNLQSPQTDETSVSTKPNFVWQESVSATNYYFQVSVRHPTFVDTDLIRSISLTNTNTILPFELLPNTEYYWRVKASGSGGNSNWSPIWHFRTTSTTSTPCPQSGEVILYYNANYDCNGQGENGGYVQHISAGWQNIAGGMNENASSVKIPSGWSVMLYEHVDRGGGKKCLNSTDSGLSDFNFLGNFPNTGVPINDHVSSFEVFTTTGCSIDGGTLHPPTLMSPSNGQALSSRSVHFTWQSPNATNQKGYTFRLNTTPNPDTEPWLEDTGLGNEYTSYDFTLPSEGTYYWHMRTWDTSEQASRWETRSFVITSTDGVEVCDAMNHGAPCKTYTHVSNDTCNNLAGDGWDNQIESLRFKGAYVGGYEVILYDDNSCGTYIARYGSDASTLGMLNNLTGSFRIEWRNKPDDNDYPPEGFTWCAEEFKRCNFNGTVEVVYGAQRSWTSPHSFTNGVDCNNNVFGADPIPGVTKKCYIKIGELPGIPCAKEGDICSFGNTNVATVYYGLYGIYYTKAGVVSSISCSNGPFGGDPYIGLLKNCYYAVTGTTLPGQSSKNTPSNGTTDQPLNVTLSWSNSNGATSYQYCYDTSNNGSCDTIWNDIGTDTSVNVPGLSPGTTYYWQVRAINNSGSIDADVNTWWSFTTATNAETRVSTTVNVPSVDPGEMALVSVSLLNLPPNAYVSAEFTCSSNPTLVETNNNVTDAGLFGPDPATAVTK